jgi:hypothetical protein
VTPLKMEVLRQVAEQRYLTTRQVAAVMGSSAVAVRHHLRDLQQWRLLRRVPVHGAAVGSAALLSDDLHLATAEGIKTLRRAGLVGREVTAGEPASVAFLAHELEVRDFLGWLCGSARANPGHAVERWSCVRPPCLFGTVPDAVFHYRFRPGETASTVAALLEADRGTEHGAAGGRTDRWASKLAAYATAFREEGRAALRAATDAPVARVVAVAPDVARAEWIVRRAADTAAAPFVWAAAKTELAGSDASAPVWLRPDGSRQPFVPPAAAGKGT